MHFSALLASGRPLLADGGMGTGLFAAGLPLGTAPESWVLEHPAPVTALHGAFAAAGADILLTVTFGANRRRLAASGLEDRMDDINAAAVDLAHRAAAEAGRPVTVAGAIGPTGDRPGGPGWRSTDEIAAVFSEQALLLSAAGAGLLWFETLSTVAEMQVAARAASAAARPFVLTASFQADGKTLAGLGPAEIAAAVPRLPSRPLAIGANCGTGPDDMQPVITAFAETRLRIPLIAKPSAGLPLVRAGRLDYPVGPDAFARFAGTALADGVAVVGGCCGALPAHLRAMRRVMDEASSRPASV